MSDIQVFKTFGNKIEVHPQYIGCRVVSQFDVKVPIGQIAGVKKDWLGQVEIQMSGGEKYKVSLGKKAKDCVKAIEKALYGE